MAELYWLHRSTHKNILEHGYIGVSIDSNRRLNEHQRSCNPHLNNAFKKYNDITKTILLIGDEDYCYHIEAKLRPYREIGWNIAEGGNKPPRITKETHPDIVESNTKKRTGIKRPDHAKLLKERYANGEMSYLGMTGRKHSEETKRKMSEARAAYWRNKNV